jgi:alkanesulfonate monooxygenase SsuD/methylene tetrahydromethanopterin reductase-like flavin-dependent oxidoreductase (luciferase family)
MTALAALTKKVRLGFSMLIPGFRYPPVLAKMAASLDEISNGRLIMGFGAGWFKKEYDAYGISWEEHDDLIEIEREAVLVMKALWTQSIASFSGRYYHVKEAVMEPKTIQKPHPPIWIGGNSSKTMEVAAELGDGWFSDAIPPEELKDKIASIKKTVRDRPMEYATTFGDRPSDKTSETIGEVRRYAEAGVTLLVICFHDAKALESFAERILPNI